MKLRTLPRSYWVLVAGTALSAVVWIGWPWSVAILVLLVIGVAAGSEIARWLLTLYLGLTLLLTLLLVLVLVPDVNGSALDWVLLASWALVILFALVALWSPSLRARRRGGKRLTPSSTPRTALP